ncbi:MAG: hypothetical protein IJQ80_03365 [Clostridia bacterium]|nr:hypothetical protein [Clostridia bacterium]
MNGPQTSEALYSLAMEHEKEYEERLSALDPTNKTEIKALKMLHNFTKICAGFARYVEKDRSVRESQIRFFHIFDEYLSYLDTLEIDDRDSFLIFAASVSMVYSHFYVRAKSVVEEEPENADEAFEAKLKYDCTREILEKWIVWWSENGCVKCEVSL